jgi:predicted ribosomally synthesized peptide with SipW-like signal peptide
MEKGKNNTILLTVIGIATLLVAIVGATFAYFSAQTQYNDSNSVLTIQSAAGGTSSFAGGDTITVENIYPDNDTVWVSKTVNITYKNTTTTLDYKYNLKLVYTNGFSSGSLSYSFAPASDAVCQKDGSLTEEECTNSTMVSTSSTSGDTLITTKTGTLEYTEGTAKTIDLGEGIFKPTGADGANHVYVLTITFPDTNANQNAEQGKSLTAHISYSEVK